MGRFVKGDVVVLPFPFSDLTANKKRPALVVANLSGDDIIVCLITSQNAKDSYAIPLSNNDFKSGSLKQQHSPKPSFYGGFKYRSLPHRHFGREKVGRSNDKNY